MLAAAEDRAGDELHGAHRRAAADQLGAAVVSHEECVLADDESGDRVFSDLDGVAGADETAHGDGLAVDLDLALGGAHALPARGLRESDAQRGGHAHAGGECEKRAAALNVHAGKSTLTKPSRSPGHAQSSRAGNQSLSSAAR